MISLKVNIRGEKIEITPSIREYVETKIAKLNPYFKKHEGIVAEIVIRVRGHEQIIEVTVPTEMFKLRAEEVNDDLYASIDLVVDVLERQIRKNKSRLKRYRHQNVDLGFDFEYEKDKDTPTDELKIVKRKEADSKPMAEEEAILQMELLNHSFFVFKNTDEECTSVIYLRKDGNYGIINIR